MPHPDGGTCPPVGIYALKHGARIGKNLRRAVQDKQPEPFRYPGLGQGVSIGRRTAVGELKGIPIRGLFCWIVWRSMLFYFFPTWDRRLRLLADWSIWPLVGRDIVQLGRGEPRRVRDPAPRLPAGPGDRRAGASRAPRARDRRGRGRARHGRERSSRTSARAITSAASRSSSRGRTPPGRGRSSAPSRCGPTRRTSSRTCCSRPTASSRGPGPSRPSGPKTCPRRRCVRR